MDTRNAYCLYLTLKDGDAAKIPFFWNPFSIFITFSSEDLFSGNHYSLNLICRRHSTVGEWCYDNLRIWT
jgi:hypothetical protein